MPRVSKRADGIESAVKDSRMRTKLPLQKETPKSSDKNKNKNKTEQLKPKMEFMSVPQPMNFWIPCPSGWRGAIGRRSLRRRCSDGMCSATRT